MDKHSYYNQWGVDVFNLLNSFVSFGKDIDVLGVRWVSSSPGSPSADWVTLGEPLNFIWVVKQGE